MTLLWISLLLLPVGVVAGLASKRLSTFAKCALDLGIGATPLAGLVCTFVFC
jgi:hypothetical protein